MKFKFLFLVLMISVFSISTIQAQEKSSKTEKVKIEKSTEKLCTNCGEIKGSEKCCKPEGRVKCEKCGLFKDSPGCCKMAKTEKKETKKDGVSASKCGEKSTSGCCDKPKKK